jgi:hypothetical protein
MSPSVRTIFPLFALLALRWAGGCPRCKRDVWLPNWRCSVILLLTTCKSSNSAIPSSGQMRDTEEASHSSCDSVPALCMVLRWVQPNSNQVHPMFCVKLLWSCLPSPRAPSLHMSSVNSGFCMYSCTNPWKFFIRSSSRPYCVILDQENNLI